MDLRAICPFGFALSLVAISLSAQAPTPKPAPAPTPAPVPTKDVDQQVLEMRRQMTEGRTFRSHVRVTVRLKNGNRMSGIVKDGVVVERIDGIRFVAAEASEPGAGIRLHYWNGKGNFVFLPFSEILEYRINGRITAAELTLIEREEREREAAQKQKQAADAPDAAAQAAAQAPPPPPPAPVVEGVPSPAPTPNGTTGAAGGVTAELQAMYALVQEFPPSAGWSQARRDDIAKRQVVVGSKPSASEQRFVDHFAEWQRACALFGGKPASGDGAGDGSGTGDDSGGRSRRGRNK